MTYEQTKHQSTISQTHTIMGKEKHCFGKGFSQFVSKMFWHLNQQSVPIYSFSNQRRLSSSSSSSKRSIKKHGSKCPYQNSVINRNQIRNQYPARYRPSSLRRISTLASIQEE